MGILIKNLKAITERYPLSDFLPYIAYEDDLYLLADGGIGVIYECVPLTGSNEEIIGVLRSLYESSSLPAYTSINIFLFASPNIKPLLNRWEKSRNGIYKDMAAMRIKYYEDNNKNSLFPGLTFKGRNFILVISAKTPGSTKPNEARKNIRILKEELSSIESILQSAYMYPEAMEPQSLIHLIYEVLNPGHHTNEAPIYSETDEIRKQIIMSDNLIKVEKDKLILDGYTVQSLTVKTYADYVALWNMSSAIGDTVQNNRQVFSPFVISLTTTILAEKDRKMLEMKASRIKYNSYGPMAKIFPNMVSRSENFDIITQGLDKGPSLVKAKFHIWIYGKDEKECNKSVKAMQALYKSKGFSLQKDIYIPLILMLTSLPLGYIHEVEPRLYRAKTMLSTNSVNISPIMTDWKGTGTPEIQLFGRRGQIMYIDLFDGIEFAGGNANAIVAGVSGSGKSFFINEIIMSYLGTGGTVRIIDVGRSYHKICKLLNGEFMEFTPESNICLNPFTHVNSIDDDMDIIRPLVAQMASPDKALDNLRIQFIAKAIKEAYLKDGTQTTITNVAEQLKTIKDSRANDVATMLYPYTKEGEYAKYFEGGNNINFNNPLVVLELEELKTKKDLQGVVLILLMFKIQKEMYQSHLQNRKKKKLVLIDEAWALIGDGSAGKFIEEGYRRFRKYGGSAIAITQSLSEFHKNNSTKAMLASSDWQFILRQKPETLEELYREKKLDVSKPELNLMKSLFTLKGKYSEIFIRSSLGSGIGRLIVDPFSMLLYSTNANDISRIDAKMKKGISLVESIKSIVKEDQSCGV